MYYTGCSLHQRVESTRFFESKFRKKKRNLGKVQRLPTEQNENLNGFPEKTNPSELHV